MGEYLRIQKADREERYKTSYHQEIVTVEQDIGKFITIIHECQSCYGLQKTDHLVLGKKKVPENLTIVTNNQHSCVAFLYETGSPLTSRLKNWNQVVVANPKIKFFLLRDRNQMPPIVSKVAKLELDKFIHCSHTRFIEFDIKVRVDLDLFYQMIVDIQNYDFEYNLQQALVEFSHLEPKNWIVGLLQGQDFF